MKNMYNWYVCKLDIHCESEVEGVMDITNRCFGENYLCREEITEEYECGVVKLPTGKICGFVLYKGKETVEKPGFGVGFIKTIAVDTLCRKMGIATDLLKYAQEELNKMGFQYSYAILWDRNEKLVSGIFAAQGYAPTQVLKYHWHNQNCIHCGPNACKCDGIIYKHISQRTIPIL